MPNFAELSIEQLVRPEGYDCECGKHHVCELKYLKIGRGVITETPKMIEALGKKKPFVVCDKNTYEVAGKRVDEILTSANVEHIMYIVPGERIAPSEWETGSIMMHFDPTCDMFLAVGSGVLNDLCKVVAHASNRICAVVGTAPSMDGYASNSSSMIQNGIKVSLYNACPLAIIADLDIMKEAPMKMLMAGLGDVLAKCIALCDWKMSTLVVDDPYCDALAHMMRYCVRKCLDNAAGLVHREPEAVRSVIEGLVLSGVAMSFANCSRPASGLEHYFSHLWEMMTLQRHGENELHGIQVGVGTCLCLKIYKELRKVKPNYEHAMAMREKFSQEEWEEEMKRIFGSTAHTIIEGERKSWHKNEAEGHKKRVERIIEHWDEIVETLDFELPDADETVAHLKSLGIPTTPADIGFSHEDTVNAYIGAREIRNKYMSVSLMWDLGILKDFISCLD